MTFNTQNNLLSRYISFKNYQQLDHHKLCTPWWNVQYFLFLLMSILSKRCILLLFKELFIPRIHYLRYHSGLFTWQSWIFQIIILMCAILALNTESPMIWKRPTWHKQDQICLSCRKRWNWCWLDTLGWRDSCCSTQTSVVGSEFNSLKVSHHMTYEKIYIMKY